MDGVFNLHTIFFRKAFALHSSCLRSPFRQPHRAGQNIFAAFCSSALRDRHILSHLVLVGQRMARIILATYVNWSGDWSPCTTWSLGGHTRGATAAGKW